MRPLEAPAGRAILGAALLLAVAAPGSLIAEPMCRAPVGGNAVVTGATASGTLLTAGGREVVLAGLAFRQDIAVTGESGTAPPLAAAIARIALGPVAIAPEGAPDRYDRIRAQVYGGGFQWLQAELVTHGLAIVRPDGGDTACVRSLLALERAARQAGAGLWGDARIVVKATDQSSLLAKSGLYALVEGRVVSVGYGSRMVFLDFGRNFRTDFTVMVPKTLVPRLGEAEITVDSLAGRAIRVRGVIEETGGPAIRLTDPLALELLDGEE
jgi:hypothetical protein